MIPAVRKFGATGVTILALVAPPKVAEATRYQVLYEFCSLQNCADGENPTAGLISDAQENLYGTTLYGGGGTNCGAYGCGVVFKLTPDGKESVLHAFVGGAGDGGSPWGKLITDGSGNLYGMTRWGGTAQSCFTGGNGCGTVFKVTPKGTETILHIFTGGSDGVLPLAGLVADRNGNFYGTTSEGGGSGCLDGYGCGTVFEIAADGTETVLYRFCSEQNCSDGAEPLSDLIIDDKGRLYGTTWDGGAYVGGTVFRLDPDGKEKVLYSFKGGSDGKLSAAGVIADKAGNLYGTTESGGGGSRCGGYGCGTAFELAADGTETVLHAFSNGTRGREPTAALFRDGDGNLYGTTLFSYGGRGGLVFKLAPDGTYTVLEGIKSPYWGLQAPLIGRNEYLYGTVTFGYGALFRVRK